MLLTQMTFDGDDGAFLTSSISLTLMALMNQHEYFEIKLLIVGMLNLTNLTVFWYATRVQQSSP